ncbi:hypothetical protein K474DRAFT_806077 [Panus rudis PR-1116 ss-1]|nr:hypothetical protein K474DRAFT_806077 [Panus rudis PR-1116 ss-1]
MGRQQDSMTKYPLSLPLVVVASNSEHASLLRVRCVASSKHPDRRPLTQSLERFFQLVTRGFRIGRPWGCQSGRRYPTAFTGNFRNSNSRTSIHRSAGSVCATVTGKSSTHSTQPLRTHFSRLEKSIGTTGEGQSGGSTEPTTRPYFPSVSQYSIRRAGGREC